MCYQKQPDMHKRMNLQTVLPKGYNAMLTLSGSGATAKLSATHRNLIFMRASQINGCAFCMDMHSKEALHAGETQQRLFTLNAWRDTPFFTAEEQALLALTEEVTLIHQHVKDATYEQAVQLLGEEYVAAAIMAIVIINGWNRISIATGAMPAAE